MKMILSRLLLWQKFLFLAALIALVVAMPLGLYMHESNKAIEAAQLEVRGLPLIKAALDLILLTQQHRGLSNMVLSGDASAIDPGSAKRKEIDQAQAPLEEVIRQANNPVIHDLWQKCKSNWPAVLSKVTSGKAKDSFVAHTAQVDCLMDLVDVLNDHYGLSLDPEYETYYLIDVVLLRGPAMIETLARLRGTGSGMLVAQKADMEGKIALTALLGRVTDSYEANKKSLLKVAGVNPHLKVKIDELLRREQNMGSVVVLSTTQNILQATGLTHPPQQYFASLSEAIGNQVQSNGTLLSELEVLLQARLTNLRTTFYSLMGVLLTLLGLNGWLCLLIVRSVTQPLQKAVIAADHVAQGDLTFVVEVEGRDEIGHLQEAMKRMRDSLIGIVSQVRLGTDTIAAASSQIEAGNLDLSARTEQQASSLEETASSMEELSATVKQNAEHARAANVLAQSAQAVAGKGGVVVAEVVTTMAAINDSARKIVDIIGVIDGIAFQTNILALNAAVEAARAGEQGRGFAVVASEVRSLAQRSASAAKEIKMLISNSVEKVDSGSKLVEQAGSTMNEIVASVTRVTDIMADITMASAEQTAGIEQINKAITQMDDATQQNAALVEEAAAAASAMRQQAHKQLEIVSIFKLDGQSFQAGAGKPVSSLLLAR